MDQPIIIATCRHTLDNGDFCKAPTVDGTYYCRHHLALRERLRGSARAGRRTPALALPNLLNFRSMRLGAAQIRAAMDAGTLDPAMGKNLLYGLRIAQTALRGIAESETAPRLPPSPKSNGIY
jgi:hypothetical protein